MEGRKTRHGGMREVVVVVVVGLPGCQTVPARKESEWPESSPPPPPAQLSETDQRMSLETQNRRISLVKIICGTELRFYIFLKLSMSVQRIQRTVNNEKKVVLFLKYGHLENFINSAKHLPTLSHCNRPSPPGCGP